MAITKLPKELSADLNVIKSLIDERTAAIEVNTKKIQVLDKENGEYRREVELLKEDLLDKAGIKSKKNRKGISERGEKRAEEIPA